MIENLVHGVQRQVLKVLPNFGLHQVAFTKKTPSSTGKSHSFDSQFHS